MSCRMCRPAAQRLSIDDSQMVPKVPRMIVCTRGTMTLAPAGSDT